ncbi:OLC1v1022358C1 [Oldenlandia corymbosa var. corymbosa]|uniref:OLC1v1022358C1 n=1 Tax=Oldenlandia corymbosa var. corymbosa TaxID=529605 RepID=A0AAV1BZ07_OLDCO|nr:OLC1v1022358C1 [Oldenlandia corymbosa var. corymbosa]
MVNVLKKVWETVSVWSSPATPRDGSVSNQLPDRVQQQISYYLQNSSTGEFDRIPLDIFFQILKLLGPNEAAKLSTVCKAWKFVVADNRLWIYFLQNHQKEPWDSIFFAETCLRSGYPLRTFPAQMPDLSFMQIYAQRAQVPGAIIVDGGSGYCKFGYSKYSAPSGKSATFLEFGNIESPMYSRLRHFFSTIFSRMQVKAYTQPIVVSVPICHNDDTESDRAARTQLVESIYSALFDMQVPAVCAINQAVLALFAARRTSGIVVNIGFNQTSVVPILHGKVMHKVGVEVIGLGALKLTGFLREKMQQRNLNFDSLYTVRSLKENLCYVALDYDAELLKDTEASYQVAAEGWFTLSKERFQTGEVLFQPRLAGVRTMSLQGAVALCMEHCHDAELTGDDSWFKTVVLAGGSACLPGLAERLDKEICKLLPQFMSSGIKVIPPPYGADTAWYGAKLISNMSTFPGSWCVTKKQFRQKSKRRW